MGKVGHTSLTGRVLKALSIFGSIEAVNMLCAVIRTKLVALWIGTAGVGIMSLYSSTIEMIRMFSQLNIRQSAVREIASADADDRPELADITLRISFWIGLAGAVLVAAFSPVLSLVTFGNYDYAWGYAILSLIVLFSSVSDARKAVIQGLGRLSVLARISLWSVLISTGLAIPLFYFFRMQAIVPVMVIFAATTLGCSLIPKISRPQAKPSPQRIRIVANAYVRLGLYLSLALAVGFFAEYLLRVFINATSDVATVGQFQAGFTIINSYVGVIFTAISMEFYPRLSATIRRDKVTSTIVAHEVCLMQWVLMPVIIVFITVSSLIIRILYTEAFLDVLPYINVAIIATGMRATSWCFSYVIIARAEGPAYLFTESVSAISLLIFSFFGWRYGGFAGLGWAFVAQYVAFTGATALVCKYRYHLRLHPAMLWLTCATTLAGVAAMYIHSFNPLLPLLLLIPVLPLTWRAIRR